MGRATETTTRIVLADDDSDWRDLAATFLEGSGYEVRQAMDGGELQSILQVAQANGTCPDLVVSDHRMPIATGLEVLEWAAVHLPDVPFILLSAFAASAIRTPALELGAAAVFEKPIAVHLLRQRIDEILTQRRRHN